MPRTYPRFMALTCNIDANGRRIRFFMGIVLLTIGLLLGIFWAWPTKDWRAWVPVGILLISGAFGLFEARAGWCAMRAMGFKVKF